MIVARPSLLPSSASCHDVPNQDLRVPPSNHFEKLRANLAGFQSIRFNGQGRLMFRWDGSRGEAEGVNLNDHSHGAHPPAYSGTVPTSG